ncbi:MAG TPA: sugar ABC transporter ATP-binding protein [Steroidobacteraceae bacterium]|nr:sugar ABC transporter ATP-binding protein [Steroidobacteraceae bacterium]
MKVTMQGISKSLGPVRVLDGIDFSVAGGEIHALVGENGAGKSTLMKILSGAHSADSGSIRIDGEAVSIRSTREAEALGIAIIHQELNMIPQLSVMDNLFLGREPNRWGVIERGRLHGASASWLSKVGAGQIDVSRTAQTLSIGLQQLVEIAKALSLNARVLIMDEPTASLTDREIGTLFAIMTDLKSRGVGIVYVSHRMEEIFKICDRVSVLRDGHFVGERLVAETGFDELVKMMVGRELKERFPKREVSLGSVRLKVEDLTDQGHIAGIHFEVRAGEVLGVAGLIGAGRSRILNTLFGVNPKTAGEVLLDGKPQSIASPADAIAAGLGFVTEDRKSQGLVLGLSLRENITLVHLKKYAHAGVIDRKAEDAAVKELMDELQIRARDAELEVKALSGGNQQKVVFAKWLAEPPKVLLLDEPTRGVDVGGKAEIYHTINRLAAAGTAIVMVSSELPEVLAMSDRILVMREGRQTGIFDAKSTNQEQILTAATAGLRAS